MGCDLSINNRIELLRTEMSKLGIDAYIIPSSDFHQTEYVGEYFKAKAFISGFNGSAGTVVITTEGAYLWTDGRYFIQAAHEISDSEVKLCRMGDPGVPTILEFLKDNLYEGANLGFDGRVISVNEGLDYATLMTNKNGTCSYEHDLISKIWTDGRPELSTEPAFFLEDKYTGETTASKLSRIRKEMAELGADSHLVTTLDDICWIFNYRGNDVECNPLVLAYAIIKMDSVDLYVDANKFDSTINSNLVANNVTCHGYNAVYEDIKHIKNTSLLLENIKANYTLYKSIDSSVTIINASNPSSLMKAMKNDVELDNIRKAHIKDGIAVTKFMYWLKENIGKIPMDEMGCADKLEELRAEQGDFFGPSFIPISAYGGNAAMCHYRATEESNKVIETKGLYLHDSGANFIEGSTDITRTFAVGPLTEEEIHHFTTVCRAMLRLSAAQFKYGTCGYNLDALARGIMWNENLDYNHGTGHGVGYLTSIHEGPANIRWQASSCPTVFIENGMVFSNEPGMYVEGKHGIRTENLVIARNGIKNDFGQFMYFETLAFAPIDLDAINPELMTMEEKDQLNAYHQEVFEKIAPHINEDEKNWLKQYTRAI